MNRRTLALSGLFFLVSMSLQAAADVYKCSKMGQTIYSDQPCKRLGASTQEVLTREKLEQRLTIVPSAGRASNPEATNARDTEARHAPPPRVTPPHQEKRE